MPYLYTAVAVVLVIAGVVALVMIRTFRAYKNSGEMPVPLSMLGRSPRNGDWSLKSENPAWCVSGTAAHWMRDGLPAETENVIGQLQEKHGEPPDDLTFTWREGLYSWSQKVRIPHATRES